jgi:hypothetical protein
MIIEYKLNQVILRDIKKSVKLLLVGQLNKHRLVEVKVVLVWVTHLTLITNIRLNIFL